jgi:outer membrane protein
MKKLYVYFVFSVFLIGFAETVNGQSKLTLDDAVRIALERNQQLASTRYEVRKARAQVNEAYGTALPSLDLRGDYSHALKKPVFFLPDFENPESGRIVPIEIGSDHAFNVTISARQKLFDYAVFTGVGAAKTYATAAHEMYRAKELEVVANVRIAFYGVLLAAEVRDMMYANLQNAEDNLRNVRLLSSQGIVSEYDELRATVGVDNLRPAVIQSENRFALALDALKSAMGIDVREEIEIDGNLEFRKVNNELLASAQNNVLTTNASIQAMRLQVDVNRAYINYERSRYIPTIELFGNYQYQAAKNQFNFSGNDFIGSSIVGISFSFNLFQGFQTNSRVQQATMELRKSEQQLSAYETALKTMVHSTLLKIEEAERRVQSQERTVEQAEKGYRIATTRYVNGSGTQLEVNDAQLALTQAQLNKMQAVYDYLVASAELDNVLGRMPDTFR